MKYRIVKKWDRYGEKDEVRARFYLEVFYRKWYQLSAQWNPLTETIYGWGDVYEQDVVYREEKDAVEHLYNLLDMVPQDEVIIVASAGTN